MKDLLPPSIPTIFPSILHWVTHIQHYIDRIKNDLVCKPDTKLEHNYKAVGEIIGLVQNVYASFGVK